MSDDQITTRDVGANQTESEAESTTAAEYSVEELHHELKLGSRARGIETLFRTAYRVQLDLTAIADNKANIMITVNGIILSVMLAAGVSLDADRRWLFIPLLIGLGGSLAAMIFAVLAAKPRLLTEHLAGPSDLREQTNLLFFGNYTSLREDEFLDALTDLLADNNRTHRMMMRDIYGIGTVLTSKFAYLRRSYSALVIGAASSVASFLLIYSLRP